MKEKNRRLVSYRRYSLSGQPTPFLPIEGKFLEQYGFTVGSIVDVQYTNGLVSIKKILQDRYENKFKS